MSVIDNKAGRLFIVLSGFFLANAIMSEFVGVKIFSLEATLDSCAMASARRSTSSRSPRSKKRR